jgi:hypothetical protein
VMLAQRHPEALCTASIPVLRLLPCSTELRTQTVCLLNHSQQLQQCSHQERHMYLQYSGDTAKVVDSFDESLGGTVRMRATDRQTTEVSKAQDVRTCVGWQPRP